MMESCSVLDKNLFGSGVVFKSSSNENRVSLLSFVPKFDERTSDFDQDSGENDLKKVASLSVAHSVSNVFKEEKNVPDESSVSSISLESAVSADSLEDHNGEVESSSVSSCTSEQSFVEKPSSVR